MPEEKEKKTGKLWSWLEKNEEKIGTYALWIVIILALATRIYYFLQTYNQPVWWDEGDYLNLARAWAFGQPSWDLNPLRPVLFSLILAGLMKMNAPELVLRLIPLILSIFAVFLTYKIGKMFYNRFVGIAAAFMLTVFWSFLFFSFRLLVDVPVATLWLLALYLFWRGYIEDRKKDMLWFGPVLVIAFLMKFTAGLLAIIILIYLLSTEGFTWLKNKSLWKSAAYGSVVLLPFLIFEFVKFGSPIAFYTAAIGGRAESPRSMLQTVFDYMNVTLPLIKIVYLAFFIIGLLTFIKLFFCLDQLRKKHEHHLKADLMLLLTAIIPFAYLISIGYGSYIEERYLFLIYPLIFIIAAKGLYLVYTKIRQVHLPSAYLGVIILIVLGAYQNLAFAEKAITDKASSFIQVKQAGEWIQEHSNPEDQIVSFHTQAELQYASNRRVQGIPGSNQEELFSYLKEKNIRYYVANVFVLPDEKNTWKIIFPFNYPETFKPVLSLGPAIDKEGKVPILTVFEVDILKRM